MPSTLVIVGQNMPDRATDRLVALHDRTWIFEPLPECAAACRKAYPAATVIEAACSWGFGCHEFHVYNQDGLSSSLGTMTEQARHLYSNCDLSLKRTIRVVTVSLFEMLRMHGVTEVATLIIDAQGADLDILKTMKPMIGRIGYIQCEADGPGARHYDGLPSNSEADFQAFMSQFPQYEFGRLPNRNAHNPDLYWQLKGAS